MIKKNYLRNTMILLLVMILGVLGGCADSTNTVAVPRQLEPIEQESRTDEEKPIEKAVRTDHKVTSSSYDALNKFSYELFGENIDEENPVLSPVSAYIALSMAGLGAQNNTKEQFASVFGDEADVTALCDRLMTALPAKTQNTTITLANSAWIDEEFEVQDSWISDIDSLMHSEVFHENLSSSDVTDHMNQWIDNKTNGLIDKMIEEPFDSRTKLVLFNTLYFKAKWEDSFDPYSVYDDSFYCEDGSEMTAELMHKQSDMEYFSNDYAQGLVFPYLKDEEHDGHFAFVAVKPADETMTVREMYQKLTPEAVKELLADRKTESVNTKLPKFELDFDKVLNDGLINMGLDDAFDPKKADFSGISEFYIENSEENLYITLVRQKAKIIVDEEGTEAAAVTAVMMECGAALVEELPREVFFDRPFVYMIMDMDTQVPLFIGILDMPAASY